MTVQADRAGQGRHLKKINELGSRQELLEYAMAWAHELDTINLCTILYRLAKLYSLPEAGRSAKQAWQKDLLEQPAFTLLLKTLEAHLLEAHTVLRTRSKVAGLDARCMSNLLWSLVKLGVTDAQGYAVSAVAVDLPLTSAPLVIHFLHDSTGQGLANLLWSYAQISASPSKVLKQIVERMVLLLEQCPSSMDPQALSDALWSIAHLRTKPHPVDQCPDWQMSVTSFLLLATHRCNEILAGTAKQSLLRGTAGQAKSTPYFTYSGMARIVWSVSMMLGSACSTQEPFPRLFALIRTRILARLRTMILHSAHRDGQGALKESTLCRVVQAYSEGQLLDSELLQAVFDVVALKLGRGSGNGSDGNDEPLVFKTEELTVFLRAAQTGVASPHAFLAALSRLITQYPEAALTWPAEAQVLLQQTLQLHRSPSPTATPTLGLAYDNNPQALLTSTMRNAAPSMNIVMPRSSLDSAGYPRAALSAAYQAAVPLGGSSVAASLIPRAGSPNQAGSSRLLDSAPAISLRVAQYEGLVGRDSPVCQQDGQSLSSVRSAPEPVHLMLLQQLEQLSVSPGRGSPEAMPRTSAGSAPVLSGVPGGYTLQQVLVLNGHGVLQPMHVLTPTQQQNDNNALVLRTMPTYY